MIDTTYTGLICHSDKKFWVTNGKLHRTDGPAIEYVSGTREWWVNGKLHRTDGPAIEYASGNREWWVNGKLHRLDGPAIEKDEIDTWYVNDWAVDFPHEFQRAAKLTDQEMCILKLKYRYDPGT